MTLGSQIRRYREALKLTLDQLAERTNVEVGTISALELRNSERSKFAGQIAKGFGLTVEQLLDESTDYLKSDSARGEAKQLPDAVEAREELPAYTSWPFEQISAADYRRLSATQRAQIEGFVLGMLASGKVRLAGSM